MFGENWLKVRAMMAELRSHGICLNDVKPGNVTIH